MPMPIVIGSAIRSRKWTCSPTTAHAAIITTTPASSHAIVTRPWRRTAEHSRTPRGSSRSSANSDHPRRVALHHGDDVGDDERLAGDERVRRQRSTARAAAAKREAVVDVERVEAARAAHDDEPAARAVLLDERPRELGGHVRVADRARGRPAAAACASRALLLVGERRRELGVVEQRRGSRRARRASRAARGGSRSSRLTHVADPALLAGRACPVGAELGDERRDDLAALVDGDRRADTPARSSRCSVLDRALDLGVERRARLRSPAVRRLQVAPVVRERIAGDVDAPRSTTRDAVIERRPAITRPARPAAREERARGRRRSRACCRA